jgi:hypothetical protein
MRFSVKVFPGVRVYGGRSRPRKKQPPVNPTVAYWSALIGWALMMTFVIWTGISQHSLSLGFGGAIGVTLGALYMIAKTPNRP